jgi:hypothetical protein
LSEFAEYLSRAGVTSLSELSPPLLAAFIVERAPGMAPRTRRDLCGQALQKPLFGKAIHRLMNRESSGGQIVFTPKLITQSPRQLVAHLLCGDCEERMAKFGEAPALALINGGNTFPLLDRLKLAAPIETDVQLAAYSGRGMGSSGSSWKCICSSHGLLRRRGPAYRQRSMAGANPG